MAKVYLVALGLMVLIYVPGVNVTLMYGIALSLGIVACFIPATSFLLEGRVLKQLKKIGWAAVLKTSRRLVYVVSGFLLLYFLSGLESEVISFFGLALFYIASLGLAIASLWAIGGGIVLIAVYWPNLVLFVIALFFIPVIIMFVLFILPMTIVTIVRMIILFNSETPLSLVVKDHAKLSADQFKARLEAAVETVKYKNPYSQVKMNYEESLARELTNLSSAKRKMLHEAMMQLDFEDAYLDVKDFIPEYKNSASSSSI